MRNLYRKTLLLILFISLSLAAFTQNESPKAHYRGILQLGYMAATGTNGLDRIPFDFINGIQINRHIFLGFGAGLRLYSFNYLKSYVYPVYMNTRINFTKKANSAFFSLNLGYTFDTGNKFEKTGYLFSPAIGVNIPVKDHLSFNFGFGIEMQGYTSIDSYEYYSKSQKTSSALSVFAGFSF